MLNCLFCLVFCSAASCYTYMQLLCNMLPFVLTTRNQDGHSTMVARARERG